ncbi:protein unc-93 homolog A-like [Glandiceps talaboti]
MKLTVEGSEDDTQTFLTDSAAYTESFTKLQQRQCWKNLLVLGFVFMLVFTAFNGLQNLQSTINQSAGVGVISLSTIYACFIVSCLLAPNIIDKLGSRLTMVYSITFYALYAAANLFYSAWVLIPASALLGLAAGPLWTSQGSYLTTLATRYSEVTTQSRESAISYLNGVFYMLFLSSQIWGNLISSYILFGGSNFDVSNFPGRFCGNNYCPGRDLPGGASPIGSDYKTVNVLLSVYFGSTVVGYIILRFMLDDLPNKPCSEKNGSIGGLARLTTALRLLKEQSFYLLVPLMMLSGVSMAFVYGDFTQAFITCSLGVHHIGYIMLAYGVVQAVSSFIFGRIMEYVGRFTLFTLGGACLFGLLAAMSTWEPEKGDVNLLVTVAAMWGLVDAIWQTQVSSMLGVVFPNNQESAFSNYRLWQSLGAAMTFGYSNYLCMLTKIYIAGGLLVVAMTTYVLFEYKNKQKSTALHQLSTELS